jgi:hypothetical protein
VPLITAVLFIPAGLLAANASAASQYHVFGTQLAATAANYLLTTRYSRNINYSGPKNHSVALSSNYNTTKN